MNFKKIKHLWCAAMWCAVMGSAFAQQLIPDSYVVRFKQPSASAQGLTVASLARSAAGARMGEAIISAAEAASLRSQLKISGTVANVFDRINAAHLNISAAEAAKLKSDPRVLSVEQDRVVSVAGTQMNPGWALDRLDQTSAWPNNQYNYPYDGTGRTIYILDSGLNLGNSVVASEFGGRAQIIYDVNGGNGYDCFWHGTAVASVAAGKTYGAAKNAKVVVGKITSGCTGRSSTSTMTMAFNWLVNNAPRGSIVNLSFALDYGAVDLALEDSIKAAYNAGIIVVIAAGNSSYDTSATSLTRLPQAFVVGATSNKYLITSQKDAMATFTGYGSNLAGFAPGVGVLTQDHSGQNVLADGTSFSAPYVAGLFAAGCHATGSFCNTMANAGVAYQSLKDQAVKGSIVTDGGSASLPAGTPSRFFVRNGW